MTTEPLETRTAPTTAEDGRAAKGRIASRQELIHFYRAIGIPAVVSAMQATRMTSAPRSRANDLPAFLRDAHAVG